MGKMTVPPQSARASGAAQMKRRLPAASSFTEVKVRSPIQKRQARTKENAPVLISMQCYGGLLYGDGRKQRCGADEGRRRGSGTPAFMSRRIEVLRDRGVA